MRARLRKFLPLVLLALAMQVLAPIAVCLAAGQAIADPSQIQAGAICHSTELPGSGVDDQTGAPAAHGAACAFCCLAQANASLDSPQAVFATPFRPAVRVTWHAVSHHGAPSSGGSNAQARAPPIFS
jgi:hypothetical protein